MRRIIIVAALAAACTRPAPPAKAPPVAVVAPKEQRAAPFSLDSALREAWSRAGVVPSERADDATFLRRSYLDVVGTIPTSDVTLKYLADTSPNKRGALVDSLLASP